MDKDFLILTYLILKDLNGSITLSWHEIFILFKQLSMVYIIHCAVRKVIVAHEIEESGQQSCLLNVVVRDEREIGNLEGGKSGMRLRRISFVHNIRLLCMERVRNRLAIALSTIALHAEVRYEGAEVALPMVLESLAFTLGLMPQMFQPCRVA